MSDLKDWHRLFGYAWMDFFRGTDVEVQTEVDLSLRQQFLDLLIIRYLFSPLPRRLPDGFDNFSRYNLITFKSYHEALTDWAILELIGHYVNYRKQVSPSFDNLLPEADFQLYAVSARFPEQLNVVWPLTPIRPGVWELRVGPRAIRVIVMNQLPQEEHNAMMHLFTARAELIRYGEEHYRPYSQESSSLLFQLLKQVREEMLMAESFEEFVRRTRLEIMESLTPEERRKISEENLLKLPPEERLKGLSVEELLRGLAPEVKEALIRQLKLNESAPKTD